MITEVQSKWIAKTIITLGVIYLSCVIIEVLAKDGLDNIHAILAHLYVSTSLLLKTWVRFLIWRKKVNSGYIVNN